jgi:hypothetical protein
MLFIFFFAKLWNMGNRLVWQVVLAQILNWVLLGWVGLRSLKIEVLIN